MKFAVLLAFPAIVFAADPVGQTFDRQLSGVEHDFVSLAEAVPATTYNFVPTKGDFKTVRTFAQQVKHVAAVNYIVAAGILGTKPPVDTGGENGPAAVVSKEQVVAFLKDSFAYLHKAMLFLTAENLTQPVPSPFGGNPTPRLSIALEATGHPFDHYGQMVVYARMNDIVPPASR